MKTTDLSDGDTAAVNTVLARGKDAGGDANKCTTVNNVSAEQTSTDADAVSQLSDAAKAVLDAAATGYDMLSANSDDCVLLEPQTQVCDFCYVVFYSLVDTITEFPLCY